MSQTLFTNATLACVDGDDGYGLREDAALLVEDSTIAWLGTMSDCPSATGAEIVDCKNQLVTPGLIDCHTHLVYGGDRADEFEMRLEGASYAEIAQRAERLDQPTVVAGVQADGRFVEDVQHALQPRSDLGRESYALRLASGQRACSAIQP